MGRRRKVILAVLVLYCLACWFLGFVMIQLTHDPGWREMLFLGVAAPVTLPALFLYANFLR